VTEGAAEKSEVAATKAKAAMAVAIALAESLKAKFKVGAASAINLLIPAKTAPAMSRKKNECE